MATGPRRPTSLRQIIAAQKVEIERLRSAILLLTTSSDRVGAANIARRIKESGFSDLSLDDVRDILGAEGQLLPSPLQEEKSNILLDDWMNIQLESPWLPDDAAMVQQVACPGMTPTSSSESAISVQSSKPGHVRRGDSHMLCSSFSSYIMLVLIAAQ